MPGRHPSLNRALGILVAALVFAGGAAVRVRLASRVGSRSASLWRPPPALRADFQFTEVGVELGIQFRYREPKLGRIFTGLERLLFLGSGASVADVDGDGFMDILFVTPRQGDMNHLYLNRQGRGFEEKGAEWGIADNDADAAHTSATFFDYDADGRPDLVLAGARCTQLFHNAGGRFEDVSAASGLRDCDNSMSAVPIDFDRDGWLDLYLVRYWDTTDILRASRGSFMPENYVDARNGGRNALYKNMGDGTFRDVTVAAGGGDTHWTLDAAWADLRGNGETELYLANDYGSDVVYRVQGGTLNELFPGRGLGDRRFGMGIALGDLGGDGVPHVYVSNEFVDGYQQTGAFLWRFGPRDDEPPVDQGRERGVDDCGWAWGAAFVDFDLDGREDLYVANGFVSGQRGAGDALSRLYGGMYADYSFAAGTQMALPGAVSRDPKNWPTVDWTKESYAGFQNDCLFWNRGGTFTDVAREVGLVEDADSRAVVPIDFDNNGAVDLVVTTQNGAPHVYRNEMVPAGRFVGFTLAGSSGARVEVRQDGRAYYRWVSAGHTGFLAGGDPRVHVGLPHTGAVDVTVRWAEGGTEELHALSSGRYYRVARGRGLAP